MDINSLQSRFAANQNIKFSKEKGDLIFLNVSNPLASCVISLYGAHVMSFIPKGEQDLLWMSKKSFFEIEKPIRGGIPICFPWFGPHASDKSLPQHGFARLMYWEVDSVENLANQSTQVVLKCESNEFTKKYWSHNFSAKLLVTVGKKLEVSLSYTNTGNEEFKCTDALHTYFNISDVSNISVSGLQSAEYHDGLQSDSIKIQDEELLLFKKEENRRYIKHNADCVISDNGFNRKIRVAKKNSNTTVVWNPWDVTSKNIADMEPEGYKTMVCVEAVNAYNDFVLLKPGESFTMSTIISLE